MTPQVPQPKGAPPIQQEHKSSTKFTTERGKVRHAHRIVIYGTGGIGKSSLASLLSETGLTPKFLDLENGSNDMDVNRVHGVTDWATLREAVNSQGLWAANDVVVIDSASKAEEWCFNHVIGSIRTQSGDTAKSVEDYGYGKGYQLVYEEFMRLLADLDRHFQAGRNVVLICHDCKANVPNPLGDDFIRFEPNLYQATSGKASIRERVKNWCDHMLFIGYDVAATDGKAQGGGSRTIYTAERPTFLAKSRILRGEFVFREGDATVWKQLFEKESK